MTTSILPSPTGTDASVLRHPSGAELRFEPVPGSDCTAVCVGFLVGSRMDPAGRAGMAHMFEHLRFAGTERLERGEFMDEVVGLGGATNATTSVDATRFYSVVPTEHLGRLLALESERFAHPVARFTSAMLDVERGVVLSERQQTVLNRPYGLVGAMVSEHVFDPTSGYHHMPIGQPEQLDAVTVEDCVRFAADHYVASNLRMTVAGDLSAAEAESLLETLAESLPQRGAAPVHDVELRTRHTARTTVESRWPSRVFVGTVLPPGSDQAGFQHARAAAFWLGRGATSVLARALVERRGVCTGVSFRVMGRAHEASLGIIEATPAAGVEPEDLVPVLDEELDRALRDGPTDRELDRTARLFRADQVVDDDGALARVKNLMGDWALLGTPTARDDWRTHELDAGHLLAAARGWTGANGRLEVLFA